MFIDGTKMPVVALDSDFVYLGKRFNSDMNKDNAEINLTAKLKDLLSKITNLLLKPQTKIKLLKMVIYPKLSFELKIYDFLYTWIANEMDSLVHYHIRKWVQLSVSSCITEIVRLPTNKCGLNIQSLKEYAESLRATARHSLKNSNDSDIKQLWRETASRNINTDARFGNISSLQTRIFIDGARHRTEIVRYAVWRHKRINMY